MPSFAKMPSTPMPSAPLPTPNVKVELQGADEMRKKLERIAAADMPDLMVAIVFGGQGVDYAGAVEAKRGFISGTMLEAHRTVAGEIAAKIDMAKVASGGIAKEARRATVEVWSKYLGIALARCPVKTGRLQRTGRLVVY